ncbi:tetratricopeptide repeat protein [Undibacterium luofuense]|uniref:O-linked N-acetylglucosamine transferase, SPINDLY family protein n=1 Tax=Undibacterium luofuense TaxID=2828733 RepID=UPI0030EB1DD3
MSIIARFSAKLQKLMNRRLEVLIARQHAESKDESDTSNGSLLAVKIHQAELLIASGHDKESAGDFAGAFECYLQADRLAPEFQKVALNLGNSFLHQGNLNAASEQYKRAVRLDPTYAAAHFNLGNVRDMLNQKSDAEISYLEAIRHKPDFADAYVGLGNVQSDTGRKDAAIISYRKALELIPDYHNVRCNIALALRELGDREAAVAEYELILERDNEFLEAYGNLAVVYRELGLLNKAMDICRGYLHRNPHSAMMATLLLFCMAHSEKVSPVELFDAHRRLGLQMESPFSDTWKRALRQPASGRAMRIGFVSADFFRHAVMQFLEPLLDQLQADQDIEVFIYYNNVVADEVNQRLREKYRCWFDVVSISDEEFATKIESDEIDVLVDLSGHTSGHRLPVFARRPAPVQVSWLGYPGTTGMHSMDYFLCDPFFVDDSLKKQFTEKFARLPITTTFSPVPYADPVRDLPAKGGGILTFGSFNRIEKLSDHVLMLWAEVLKALPGSRLILAGLPEKMDTSKFAELFKSSGISADRIEFHHRMDMGKYLELHHRVDVCLDTFPYTGGTTTNHALWMGVPTLTLVGATAPGRQSYANMRHVGLGDEFYASSHEEFIRKAVILSTRLDWLSELRKTLRSKFEESLFCRPDIVATSLKHAFVYMMERWTNQQTPEHFSVQWDGTKFCTIQDKSDKEVKDES